MKKIILFTLLIALNVSCQSKEEKLLNSNSVLAFERAVRKIKESEYVINIDSFRSIYDKHRSENPQLGLDFANRFDIYATKLLQKREDIKLAENIREAARRQMEIERREIEVKENAENRKIWENSKYGKLQKKHPDWTDEECMKVIDKKIWIGMSIEMLKYNRGTPDSANPSNYGNGTKWQWCWDDYTPSCFYAEDDGIITAYN